VIIANVAPTLIDAAMTKNTLKFIESIKVIMKDKIKKDLLEFNEKNPATWKNEHLRAHMIKRMERYQFDVEKFCPHENGK
jgi:c-di-GMP-binding flagellar brake protein YcgR